VTVSGDGESATGAVRVERPPSGEPDGPLVFRGALSPRAPLYPVAEPQFRRSERIEVWTPVSADMARVTARLLDRHGQPLPFAPAPRSQSLADGRRGAAVGFSLAGVGAGDYLIEVADGAERHLVAFRVVQ
jgi:hypothetical protein